jgi:hypothetical protein
MGIPWRGPRFGWQDSGPLALPPVLKLLAGFQTVASLPLLFFLGLGLRQRFRLR